MTAFKYYGCGAPISEAIGCGALNHFGNYDIRWDGDLVCRIGSNFWRRLQMETGWRFPVEKHGDSRYIDFSHVLPQVGRTYRIFADDRDLGCDARIETPDGTLLVEVSL